ETQQILDDKEVQKLVEAFKLGASYSEASLETGIEYDRIVTWNAIPGNSAFVDRLVKTPAWAAKKLFHQPTNHKEAEAVLKRHPDTKKEYSERSEHTGAEGEALFPKPILGGGSPDNNG
ncbi:MAG: hypothetical protein KJ601_07095, partial [Nanoarchaeota archaeon]|nr:hypothetical protein [Nanoarchaeota archaeon]